MNQVTKPANSYLTVIFDVVKRVELAHCTTLGTDSKRAHDGRRTKGISVYCKHRASPGVPFIVVASSASFIGKIEWLLKNEKSVFGKTRQDTDKKKLKKTAANCCFSCIRDLSSFGEYTLSSFLTAVFIVWRQNSCFKGNCGCDHLGSHIPSPKADIKIWQVCCVRMCVQTMVRSSNALLRPQPNA